MKIVITGDEIRRGERNLLIMNHRTRLDWMYFWSVLVRQSGLKTEKIILKAPLKNIPGAGMYVVCLQHVFISTVNAHVASQLCSGIYEFDKFNILCLK